MSETSAFIVALVLALLAGVLLGTIFFGGLWWTIRKGLSSKQPAALFFFSLLLRMSIALIGFYLMLHILDGSAADSGAAITLILGVVRTLDGLLVRRVPHTRCVADSIEVQ